MFFKFSKFTEQKILKFKLNHPFSKKLKLFKKMSERNVQKLKYLINFLPILKKIHHHIHYC